MMTFDFEQLIGWLDETRDEGALEEAQLRLARGDFVDQDHILKIQKWIQEEKGRLHGKWARTIEGAAVRQAEASERQAIAAEHSAKSSRISAWSAALAIGISLVSLGLSVAALYKP